MRLSCGGLHQTHPYKLQAANITKDNYTNISFILTSDSEETFTVTVWTRDAEGLLSPDNVSLTEVAPLLREFQRCGITESAIKSWILINCLISISNVSLCIRMSSLFRHLVSKLAIRWHYLAARQGFCAFQPLKLHLSTPASQS